MTKEEVVSWLYAMVPSMSLKAVELFEENGWTWGGSPGKTFVPGVGDFTRNYNELIEMVRDALYRGRLYSNYAETGRCRVEISYVPCKECFMGIISINEAYKRSLCSYTVVKE